MSKQIAVYTAIYGKYDSLKNPLFTNKIVQEADLFCFTEDPDLKSNVFRPIVEIPYPNKPRECNRYIKINGSQVLSDYEFVVYCDGSIQIIAESLHEIVRNILKNHDMAVFKHPYRNCIYTEGETCMRRRLDRPKVIYEQMLSYHHAGFPTQFGLIEASAFIRRNHKGLQKKMYLWWKEVENGSNRDQLSFDFIRWKYGIDITYFEDSFRNSRYFRSYPHICRKETTHRIDSKKIKKHIRKAAWLVPSKVYGHKMKKKLDR